MARQPALVRAIKKEMNNADFRVKVEWMEYDDFVDSYGGVVDAKVDESKPSKQKGKCGKQKMCDSESRQNRGQASCSQGKGKGKLDEVVGKSNNQQSLEKEGAGGRSREKVADTRGKGESRPGKNESETTNGIATREDGEKRVCKYFLQGACQKGAACKFVHTSAEAAGSRNDASKGKGKTKRLDGRGVGAIPCNGCGRMFATEHALQQHWESKPECAILSAYPIGLVCCHCRVCDREFDSEGALSQHLLSTGHVESFGGPQSDQAFAKQLDGQFADQLRQCLQDLRSVANLDLSNRQKFLKALQNSSSPDDFMSNCQRAVDTSYAILFEWACFLRKRGADFDLNAGNVPQGCEGCDAGPGECKTNCSRRGHPRKLLRFCAPTNVPRKTKDTASRLDQEICEAISQIGFCPVSQLQGGPMCAVAAAAMSSFLSDYGGSDTPPLLRGVPSRVPEAGLLRRLDDQALEQLRFCGSSADDFEGAPALVVPVYSDLMKLSVRELNDLLAAFGLNVAAEQAEARRRGLVEKDELVTYVDCRLTEVASARLPAVVECSFCARKFPGNVQLEHHKKSVHGRLLKYVLM